MGFVKQTCTFGMDVRDIQTYLQCPVHVSVHESKSLVVQFTTHSIKRLRPWGVNKLMYRVEYGVGGVCLYLVCMLTGSSAV